MIRNLYLRYKCWLLGVCYEHAEAKGNGTCSTCKEYYSFSAKQKRLITHLSYTRRVGSTE
jgi:hypothetical protein